MRETLFTPPIGVAPETLFSAGRGLRDAEVFATAGVPSQEIRRLADLWHADLVLYARAAKTGLRPRQQGNRPFAVVALDDAGGIARHSLMDRLFGA